MHGYLSCRYIVIDIANGLDNSTVHLKEINYCAGVKAYHCAFWSPSIVAFLLRLAIIFSISSISLSGMPFQIPAKRIMSTFFVKLLMMTSEKLSSFLLLHVSSSYASSIIVIVFVAMHICVCVHIYKSFHHLKICAAG